MHLPAVLTHTVQHLLLPPSHAAGPLPLGRCYSTRNCGASQECDLSAASPLCTCSSAGVDVCIQAGICRALPPPPPPMEPCERCTTCVSSAAMLTASLASDTTANASTRASAAYAWCSVNHTLTSCRELALAVGTSHAGNLGLRAGALCARLGRCTASLAGNASCSMSVAAGIPSGPLDVCSVPGVAGGHPVPGTGKQSAAGTCTIRCIPCIDHMRMPCTCHVRTIVSLRNNVRVHLE